MDLKRFELTMEKFFQKAGVSLLKKNQNYEGHDETAPYILLDSKRKTYYLTETDNYDGDVLPDPELEAAATYLAEKEQVPQISAKAVLALGKSITFFSEDFKLPDVDMMQLTRKSALVISEDNAEITKDYLTKRGITFQSVPFKGAFLVMFIDRASSEQISDIYQSILNNYMQSTHDDEEQPQELLEEITPANTLSFEDLLKGIPEPEDEEDEAPKAKPAPKREPESIIEPAEPSEDELLDNIDLSFIQKAAEAPKMTEEEGDLLYSKLINEQAESAKNAPSPKARNLKEIPEDVINALDEEVKQQQVEPSTEAILQEDTAKDEKAPQDEKTPKHEKPLVKSKAKKAPETDVEDEVTGLSASKIASNAAGVIFFAPAFILNKLLSRVMPPFVIYWLAAIAMMFGLYQIVFSFVSPLFYPAMTDWAREVASYTAEFVNVSDVLLPIDNLANNIIISSLIFFTGQGASVSAAENGWLLRYVASFGALLMIFPLSRRFGARITIFSLLMFFALPFILGAEAYIINTLTGTAAEALQSGSGTQARMVLASGALFAVFAVPTIIIGAVYWIAGYFIPDRSKHKEVLP